MTTSILTVFGLVIAGIAIGLYLADKPETQESLVEAAVVMCEIDDTLFDELNSLIDDPQLKHTLYMVKFGESVSVADRDNLNAYLWSIGRTATLSSVCFIVSG